MKKRLTEAEFAQATKNLSVSHQTLEIARGVLVEGKRQASFVTALGITKGAVSQAVTRVWQAHEERTDVPEGYERVSVVLPEFQASIVKKWAAAAKKKGP